MRLGLLRPRWRPLNAIKPSVLGGTLSEQVAAIPLNVDLLPTEIGGVDALIELALDLRSSWHHGADNVWQQLDPDLWRATQNPWVVCKLSRGTR